MRKLLSGILFLSLFSAPFLFADEDSKEVLVDIATDNSTKLVDSNVKRVEHSVDSMERRIEALERYKRSQDDRIRNLERQINDLRRREQHPYS